MTKWIIRLVLIGVAGLVGTATFQSYQKGYFNIPDLPSGAYIFSFQNGMRGIFLDAEVSEPISDMPKFFRRIWFANPDRRYFSVTYEVPPWFEDAWSVCSAPEQEEQVEIEQFMTEDMRRDLAGARLDAICLLEVDGEDLLRGLLYSVPKL